MTTTFTAIIANDSNFTLTVRDNLTERQAIEIARDMLHMTGHEAKRILHSMTTNEAYRNKAETLVLIKYER